jgi:type I restriction enzyme, R subunit
MRSAQRRSWSFREMIESYNRGAINIDIFFTELMQLAKSLEAEEQRHVREALAEEELAIFDLLTRRESARHSQTIAFSDLGLELLRK